MSKVIPLRAIYGEVNSDKYSSSIYLFRHEDGKDIPMPKAATLSRAQSLVNKPARIGGEMYDAMWNLTEGTLVKVFIRRRRAYGKAPLTAVAFLRMRESAAVRSWKIPLCEDHFRATLNQLDAKILGSFDWIPGIQYANYGIQIKEQFLINATESALNAVRTEEILQSEASTLPVFAQPVAVPQQAGEASIIIKRKPRALKLD